MLYTLKILWKMVKNWVRNVCTRLCDRLCDNAWRSSTTALLGIADHQHHTCHTCKKKKKFELLHMIASFNVEFPTSDCQQVHYRRFLTVCFGSLIHKTPTSHFITVFVGRYKGQQLSKFKQHITSSSALRAPSHQSSWWLVMNLITPHLESLIPARHFIGNSWLTALLSGPNLSTTD